MAPEEDAQTDVEEETKAASLCAAEHKEPLTMEQRDQGICQLLLQAQPAPTIVDSPENIEVCGISETFYAVRSQVRPACLLCFGNVLLHAARQ